jgi:hypothetical protein
MVFVLLAPTAHAQQEEPPSLDALLTRLQASLDDYRTSIPRFYCSEHIVSRNSRLYGTEIKSTMDAVFRLDHRDPPLKDPRLNLVEDHELKTVNKVPVRRDSYPMSLPMMTYGVFSNAVSVASKEMARCYDYKLHDNGSYNGHPAIEIEYNYKLKMAEDSRCLPVRSSGRAIFDAATLHPIRIEMSVPHYEVFPKSKLYGLWRWRINYIPITFDDRQFWLPGKVTSRLDSESGMTTWYFEANYSNYHKLTVKSHIVPLEGDKRPPP